MMVLSDLFALVDPALRHSMHEVEADLWSSERTLLGRVQ